MRWLRGSCAFAARGHAPWELGCPLAWCRWGTSECCARSSTAPSPACSERSRWTRCAYRRYRRGGGDGGVLGWEFGSNPSTWDQAPAPARAGRELAAKLLGYDVPIEQAGRLTNLMHWGYGPAWGAQFALVAAVRRRRPGTASGLAFGTLVRASDYVTLPLMGVYQPIWRYPKGALLEDLTAHLLFGVCAAAALRAIVTGSPARTYIPM